ncbi:MAG: D-alanyl-D-alanine carboxypeptidase [Candidatus Contendobacter sp.]|nr:D-alanyl-D-alanine carboxypeptidase [Candidatus Contendobacter sp.]
MLPKRNACPRALALVLGIVVGPALGQERWGIASQPEVAALSAVLMNPATGEVLFAKEPHLRLPPASTTKVLTALVALERLDLNARILVSPQAATAPPSRIGLRAGEAALTQDLLYGLMLKSGNDAAETLAEAAGGSVVGFAELMNARAWQIGARNSHFMNPHGLPNDDHYATAYDLALIFRQAMNHPMFADIVRTRNAALRIESNQGPYGDWRMVPVVNHNRLLGSYEGTLGGKTGFTLKARRCFVGEVDRGGVRLIVAILNSPTPGALWRDARTLLDYGFAHYGLAPLPAVEPSPILVQREPDGEESEQPEVRPALAVARAAVIRPAAREEPKAPAPDRQPSAAGAALPARPMVAVRTQEIVRPSAAVRAVATRPLVETKPIKLIKQPLTAAKPAPAKVAKPVVAAPGKPMVKPAPLVLAMAKPVPASGKVAKPAAVASGKPAVQPVKLATPAVKPEKRETTKVAAVRVEPLPKPQKAVAKRRS